MSAGMREADVSDLSSPFHQPQSPLEAGGPKGLHSTCCDQTALGVAVQSVIIHVNPCLNVCLVEIELT